MQTYKTQAGDVLDGVIYRIFGYCNDAALTTVYGMNYGLADYGPILPRGVLVALPDSLDTQTPNDTAVKLWD